MRTKRNVVILLITATVAVAMGVSGFARLSELQKAETLKTEIPLLAGKTCTYTGRSEGMFGQKDYIFTDTVNDYYVSEPEQRVTTITIAGAETKGVELPELVSVTEEEAYGTAEQWFRQVFPEVTEFRHSDVPFNGASFLYTFDEMNGEVPTGNSASIYIMGDGRLYLASYMYGTGLEAKDGQRISEEEAFLRAVEAINENNPRYYNNPEAITSEEFTEREIRLETFNGKTYYEVKGSAPLRFEGGGFTEHYMIDIDVDTGECLRLANSSGKGYDKLSK